MSSVISERALVLCSSDIFYLFTKRELSIYVL